MLSYARMLTNVSLEVPFLEYVEFFNNKDMMVKPKTKFQWKPVKCPGCHILGHEETVCKKIHVVRKE